MEKSFEEALSELEAIVKELESGNVNLDDAINKYGAKYFVSESKSLL